MFIQEEKLHAFSQYRRNVNVDQVNTIPLSDLTTSIPQRTESQADVPTYIPPNQPSGDYSTSNVKPDLKSRQLKPTTQIPFGFSPATIRQPNFSTATFLPTKERTTCLVLGLRAQILHCQCLTLRAPKHPRTNPPFRRLMLTQSCFLIVGLRPLPVRKFRNA